MSALLIFPFPAEAGVAYKSITATGGTVTTVVENNVTYKVHTFTSSGTFTVTRGSGKVWYLVVAGGGGGGRFGGGGGGAGGLRTNNTYSYPVSPGNYTVTVGNGGTGSSVSGTLGLSGGNSVFDTITSTGGGGAGGYNSMNGATGGSGAGGGGGSGAAGSGGSGTAGQGNNGGSGGGTLAGGGGGGAGATGANSTSGKNGGNGGNGLASTITGSSVTYAGGGGGGGCGNNGGACGTPGTAGSGGSGGGGAGTADATTGGNGTANTGGGGGGGGGEPIGSGGDGGSGIVIIRYPVTPTTIKASTGSGLVGWWTFDKLDMLSGRIPIDRSGFGNNLTSIVGSPLATSSLLSGRSTAFSGSDYFQRSSFSGQPLGNGARTISAWIWRGSSCPSNCVVAMFGNDDAAPRGYGLYLTPAFKLEAEFDSQTGAVVGNTTVSDTGWHHVVATYDGATNKVYLDGVLDGSTSYSSASATQGSVTIGAWSNGAAKFGGTIDDVRIYNKALSPDEIRKLYTQGLNVTPVRANSSLSQVSSFTSGLVGHWRFNGPDMAGTTVYDKSGQGNNGTLTNGPKPALGKVGQALSFDGSDDYVYTTNSFNNPQDFTLSAWFKTTSASGKKIVGFEANQSGTAFVQHDRHIWMGTDGKVRIGWWSGSANIITSTNALNDGKWHHVVGTHNAQNVGVLYIDGVQQGTAGNSAENYTGYWRIGSYNINTPAWGSGSAGYFFGSIDEVRIYNRALSAAEVKRLYDMEK